MTTVTGMATPTPTIPVTVDTFHIARGSKGPKVTTVTGMASTQPPLPKKKQVTKEKKTSQNIKLHPIFFPFNPELQRPRARECHSTISLAALLLKGLQGFDLPRPLGDVKSKNLNTVPCATKTCPLRSPSTCYKQYVVPFHSNKIV